MSDDSDIVYKLPKQILRENQQSKVMTETDQKNPIMQPSTKEILFRQMRMAPDQYVLYATKHLRINDH